MSKAAAKLSVSVPAELASTVRKRIGSRSLSGFVARAMRHELEREQLGSYLAELDKKLGKVPNRFLQQASAAWKKR